MQTIHWRQFGHVILLAGVIGIVGLILSPTSGARSVSPVTTAYATTETAVMPTETATPSQSAAVNVSYQASSPRIAYTEADLDLLARLVSSEAKGESYLGQVAAAAVTINRTLDPRFPDTLEEVIFQIEGDRYQYEPVMNGTIYEPATASARQAAWEALNGHDPTNGALGFYNPAKVRPGNWVWQWPIVAEIGNHVFFTY